MKTETISHTPTPWEIGTDGWIQAKSEIDPSMSVKMVARVNINFFTSKEDAAFIVRAVNAHEGLTKHAEYLLDAVRVWFTDAGEKDPNFPSSINAAYHGMRAAIAKAGSR